MNTNVLSAVFRRNFVSYFASPTGYVFICVFVLLSTFVAFWSPEFFNANLANLDPLNFWFPFIMLVFIPTITMGIWADERRQGTDELLLTIPAGDLDIVLGKYLAAVAIYSVSLVFSLICNYAVLAWLGDPDVGLFLATYVGYWLVGLAMLAVGMVASFLTANLTIGFILGLIFNLPLVFAAAADVIFSTFGQNVVLAIKRWSIGQQFYDFGRGVLSISGLSYFVMLAVVMLYVGMVLIGRRHWSAGQQRTAMVGHYVVRALALVLIAGGLNIVLSRYDQRFDATSEQLSSLSPQTKQLLADLQPERPVQVEAFISPTVPEAYVQTRLNVLAMLRELEARGGGKVRVRINDTERFSEEAALAERRFGITPHPVTTINRGVLSREQLFMGVAMTCGPKKPVTLPFIDRGIPVEYELVRSLATVTQQSRKKLGVLTTDAQLYGRFNPQTFSPGSNWAIIDELEKQYDVEQVDPTQPITKKYDALLAVQPSSLGLEETDHFLAAVESGQPTAVFEDPCPVFAGSVPATSMPRQPPGGMNMMFMGQQAPPKGEIDKLWRLLGIDFGGDQVIWQNYNPYPKARQFPEEFVFVDAASGARFTADNKISSKLEHLLFPFPGSITKLHSSAMEVQPLVQTGAKETGTVVFREIMQMSPFGPRGGLNPNRRQIPTNAAYTLAAQIKGKFKPNLPMADDDNQPAGSEPKDPNAQQTKPAGPSGTAPASPIKPRPLVAPETSEKEPAAEAGEKAAAQQETKADEEKEGTKQTKQEAEKPKEAEINVVLVADIDMLTEDFFRLREQGEIPEAGIHFDFDNVTFVLNLLDSLAGDQRFIDIRSRRPKHRTLTRIEKQTEEAKQKAGRTRDDFIKEYESSQQREQKALDGKIEELRKRKDVDPQQLLIEVALAQQDGQRRLEAKTEQFRQQRDRQVNQIETELALQIRRVQDQYKLWAVLLPPIPPLLLAVLVFLNRRMREREGVARSRLR